MLIDTNAPLAVAISHQFLELIPRWRSQIIENYRGIKLAELSKRGPLNICSELSRRSPVEKFFSGTVAEIADHRLMITRCVIKGN
jgi:hypothetical protein